MTFEEYQLLTTETAIYSHKKSPIGLMYCTLGLVSEFNELRETLLEEPREYDKVIKEAGDFFWYIFMHGNELDFTINEDEIENLIIDNTKDAVEIFSEISGKVKKYFRDGKRKTDRIQLQNVVKSNLLHLLKVTLNEVQNTFPEKADKILDDILETNVAKLQSRKERGVLSGSGDNR